MCTWGPNSMKGWLLIMGAIMTHHQPCNREGPLVPKLGQPETTGTMQMSLVPTHNHYNSAWRDKNWPLFLPPELGPPLLPFLFSGSWEGRRQSYFFLLSHLVSLRRKKPVLIPLLELKLPCIEHLLGIRYWEGTLHTWFHLALPPIQWGRRYCSQVVSEFEAWPRVQIQAWGADFTGATSALKELTVSCENEPHLGAARWNYIVMFARIELLVLQENNCYEPSRWTYI